MLPNRSVRSQLSILFLVKLSVIQALISVERICLLVCFCLPGQEAQSEVISSIPSTFSGTSCISRSSHTGDQAACFAPMSLFPGPSLNEMTQIPLLAFCFTHYHEFLNSPSVQENIISIFRRNSSALHQRICQALIFIIAANFLLYSFYAGFSKTFIYAAGIGGIFSLRGQVEVAEK